MTRKPSLVLAVLFMFLLLPVLAYVGSYYHLVEPGWVSGSAALMEADPIYRGNWPHAERVFRPMHWLDRRIRPSYWSWRIEFKIDSPEFKLERAPHLTPGG